MNIERARTRAERLVKALQEEKKFSNLRIASPNLSPVLREALEIESRNFDLMIEAMNDIIQDLS